MKLGNKMAKANQVSVGKVVQCIGAVVDVEFPRDQMPKVFEALIIDDASSQAEAGLTLEVQQQLGDGIVRTIASGHWYPRPHHGRTRSSYR